MSHHEPPNPLKSAHFGQSAQRPADFPADTGAEVAFAGRSNAGKSSAINRLTGHPGLARTSKTPGRTQLVNFFPLDATRRLVDLPGYGYAKVADTVRVEWHRTLSHYLEHRRSLRGLVLVMDVRHPLRPQDTDMLAWSRAARLPVHVLLTKADKLAYGRAQTVLRAVRAELAEPPGVSVQLFSAATGLGVNAARERLAEWLGIEAAGEQAKKNPGNKGRESGVEK